MSSIWRRSASRPNAARNRGRPRPPGGAAAAAAAAAAATPEPRRAATTRTRTTTTTTTTTIGMRARRKRARRRRPGRAGGAGRCARRRPTWRGTRAHRNVVSRRRVWTALDSIMPLFFRSSAANMAESLLMPDGDVDHLSLGTAAALAGMTEEQRQKKLLAIAQAGESEAGQQVTRDLVLSFLLPSSHVGVRRTLLLSRAASTQAGVDHPTLVSRAHDVAYAAHFEPLHINTYPYTRCACAGWRAPSGSGSTAPTRSSACAACSPASPCSTKGDEDPIRKADAFGGACRCHSSRPTAVVAECASDTSCPRRDAGSCSGSTNARCRGWPPRNAGSRASAT